MSAAVFEGKGKLQQKAMFSKVCGAAQEITIHGGFIGKFSLHKLPGIIESRILPLEKIVSHRLALSRAHEGLDLIGKGQAIKAILHPEDQEPVGLRPGHR